MKACAAGSAARLIPTFVVDGLGGLGKLPITPSYVREEELPDGRPPLSQVPKLQGHTIDNAVWPIISAKPHQLT